MGTKNKKYNRTGLIIAALRKIWLFSPERREAKSKAKRGKSYLCASCKQTYLKVSVDHIVPVGTFTSWDAFIERLFCPIDNLQVLCKGCHDLKSGYEREQRRSLLSKKVSPSRKKLTAPRKTLL